MSNTLYVRYSELENNSPTDWYAMVGKTFKSGVVETNEALKQTISELHIDSIRVILPSWLMAIQKLDIEKPALKYLSKTLSFNMEPFLANGIEENQYRSFCGASKNIYGVAIESSALEAINNKVENIFPDCHIQFSSIGCAVANSMSLNGAVEIEDEVITTKDGCVSSTPIDLCASFGVAPDSLLPFGQLVAENAFVPVFETGKPKRKGGDWLWKVAAVMATLAFTAFYADAWYETKQKTDYAKAINAQTTSAYLQAFPNERIVDLKRQILAKIMHANNSDTQKPLMPTEVMIALSNAASTSGAQGHLTSVRGDLGVTSIEWSSLSAKSGRKIEQALNESGQYHVKTVNTKRTSGQFVTRLTLEAAR